jgi:putative transposase
MARLPRFYVSGCSQHVIQRGNNREACFYEEQDYKVYLDYLKQSAQKYKVYKINRVRVIDLIALY